MSQPDPLLVQLELLYAERRASGAPDAAAVGEQLLAMYGEPADDPMRVRRAELRIQLGEDYAKLGDSVRAMLLFREALQMLESAAGTQSSQLAPVLVRIARTELTFGHAQAAETTVNRAATLMNDGGSDALQCAEALILNGQILGQTGKLENAKDFLRQVVVTCERTLGPYSMALSDALNSLAVVLRQCCELDQAIALHERSLEILDRFRLKDSTLIAGRLCDFAEALADKGDRERARHVVGCARGLVDVPEAPLSQTLARLLELDVDLAQGDGANPRHAVELRRRILDARTTMLGPEHVDVGLAHHNLGMSLHLAGDFDEALPHLVRAREIAEQTLGTGHPRSLLIRGNHLRLLVTLGQLDEAETGLTELIATLKAIHGPSSVPVADAESSLAEARLKRGNVLEAIALLLSCGATHKNILGAQHPKHIDTMCRVGLLLKQIDAHGRAANCFAVALEAAVQAYGQDHAQVAMLLELLFDEVMPMQELERAHAIAVQLHRFHERRGSSHGELADALARLALVHEERGELADAKERLVEALEHERKVDGFWAGSSKATYGLARVASKSRDIATASRVLVEMKDALEGTSEHVRLARVLDSLGCIAFEQGDVARAQEHWTRAFERAGTGLATLEDLPKDSEAYIEAKEVRATTGQHLVDTLSERIRSGTMDKRDTALVAELLKFFAHRLEGGAPPVQRTRDGKGKGRRGRRGKRR